MDWLPLVSIIVGAFSGALGAFIGVRVTVAKLEVQMADVRVEIRTLRDRSHEHTNVILRLDGRVTALERKDDER